MEMTGEGWEHREVKSEGFVFLWRRGAGEAKVRGLCCGSGTEWLARGAGEAKVRGLCYCEGGGLGRQK